MSKIVTLLFFSAFVVGCNFQKKSAAITNFIEVDSKEITILFNGQSYPWEIKEDNLSYP